MASGKVSEEIVAAEILVSKQSNTELIVVPDQADTQTRTAYNAKEVAALQQLFGLLVAHQFSTLKEYIAQTPVGEKRDEVLKACVQIAIASGTPLRLIYLSIVDEFKENKSDPFKADSDATKMILLYWNIVAKMYLKETVNPIVTQAMSLKADQSSNMVLLDHVNQLVDRIASRELVDKIPIPIKAVLSQINQLGNDQGKRLGGLVYCNALTDPSTHRDLKNLQILATVLRSALGVPESDPAVTLPGDVLRDIRGKLENFVDIAIKSKSVSVGNSIVNEVSTKSLNNLNKFILHHQQAVIKNLTGESAASEFSKGIEALSSYKLETHV